MCSTPPQEDIVLDAIPKGKNFVDKLVSIKVVPSASDEIRIARMLSSKRSHPNNHCVPVLDVLPDPLSPAHELLVMPYLLPFDEPPFEIVIEVLEFIRQTLEVSQWPYSRITSLAQSTYDGKCRGCASFMGRALHIGEFFRLLFDTVAHPLL